MTVDTVPASHPVLDGLSSLAKGVNDLYLKVYPLKVNTSKIYDKDMPPRKEWISLRAKVRQTEKPATKAFKVKPKREVKEDSGFLRIVKVSQPMAEFLGVSGSSIGNCYIHTAITSFISNYAAVMNLLHQGIITPDPSLVKLFGKDLLKHGIIDEDGKVLARTVVNKKGEKITVSGFPFTMLQSLIISHIHKQADGKIEPQVLTPEQKKVLNGEREKMRVLKEARNAFKSALEARDKHAKNKEKAEQFNDMRSFNEKATALNAQVAARKREVAALLKEFNFPPKAHTTTRTRRR